MILFKCFIQLRVKKALCEQDNPAGRALLFLEENPKYGIVEDYDGSPYTKEELENVKSFGSRTTTQFDHDFASGEPVSKDTYSELFGTLADHSESSSERDN